MAIYQTFLLQTYETDSQSISPSDSEDSGEFNKINSHMTLPLHSFHLETQDWNSLMNVPNKNASKIRSIHIIGERNSGTTWIYEHLGVCFNHSIPVRRRLKRYKHWFQEEHVPSEKLINGTLVLAIFRNPYEWIEAMRKTPHHSPNHMNLSWKEFVTRPWTMDRVFFDLNVTEQQKRDPHFCQEHFFYRDIVTCHQRPYPVGWFGKKTRFSQHQPFYEMRNDGSGQPFSNILELRAAKIRNFLATKTYKAVQDHWILRYEDLLRHGTKVLIQNLEAATGIQAQCQSSPPQVRRARSLDPEMVTYLMHHLDWEAENMIGYKKQYRWKL